MAVKMVKAVEKARVVARSLSLLCSLCLSWSYTSERELTAAHAVLQQSSRSVTATRDGATKGNHFINDVSD